MHFHEKLSPKFLFVDLLNNLGELGEDRSMCSRVRRSERPLS
jgi:hypothetical protein